MCRIGINGTDGLRGRRGKRGRHGEPGAKGDKGAQGVEGPPGQLIHADTGISFTFHAPVLFCHNQSLCAIHFTVLFLPCYYRVWNTTWTMSCYNAITGD